MNKMKRLLAKSVSIVIALTLIVSLAGCYQIEKLFHAGTLKGTDLCIKHNTSSVVSDDVIKRKCIKENQTDHDGVIGMAFNADVYFNPDSGVSHSWIKIKESRNVFDDIIITELLVSVTIFDSKGKKYLFKDTIDTWAEPSKLIKGQKAIFAQNKDLPEASEADVINKGRGCDSNQKYSCIDWNILQVRGIKI
tara:strand:- start:4 stop:582 length:579 start_codon:yes stop_codon:yes gene_type:complete